MGRLLSPSARLPLFEWEPPAPVVRFSDEQVRSASIAARICRGIAAALKESDLSREEISSRMSEFLGQRVSANMLNAYASQGREDHVINLVRFIALVHATGDRRLFSLIAEMFGWAVIEQRYLKLIELAGLQEQQEELRKRADSARRQAKSEGLL